MLIRGDRLPHTTRQDILRQFTYRYTIENPFRRNQRNFPPTETDYQWLASKCFYVTKTGRLDQRHNCCEPDFMEDEEWQDVPLPWQHNYVPTGKGK